MGFYEKTYTKTLLLMWMQLIVFCDTKAQNMVPNPSFEIDTACPPTTGYINFVPLWQAATIGTPDYFNICDEGGNAGIPHNEFGFQYARSGAAYTGVYTKEYNNLQYREYICAPLLSTLSAGIPYYVSMYVNCSNVNRYSTFWAPSDRIGVYLSNGYPDTTGAHTQYGGGYIHQNPQIENPAGNLIIDTINWVRISGWYTASGGENYITIGNFRSDSLTAMGGDYVSYYYIDDVCISTDSSFCIQTSGVNKLDFHNSQFTIYPNPAKDKIYIEAKEVKETKLFDIFGKEILSTKEKEIDVSKLSEGVYFLNIKTENGVTTKKIIVQH